MSGTAPDVQALRAQLGAFSVSLVADVLKPHGSDRLVMRGIVPRGQRQATMVGRARTLRFLPSRPDVAPPPGNLRMRQIDAVQPGEVLVFDVSCTPGSTAFGDMVAARAVRAGAAGVVVDGAVRDVQAIAEIGLPVYSSGIAPAPNPAAPMAWEADVPIQCGGVLVMPGDWVLADDDGVIVIPPSLVEKVVHEGQLMTRKETFCRQLIDRGHMLTESFPMPARLTPLFERYLADGNLPSEAEVRGA